MSDRESITDFGSLVVALMPDAIVDRESWDVVPDSAKQRVRGTVGQLLEPLPPEQAQLLRFLAGLFSEAGERHDIAAAARRFRRTQGAIRKMVSAAQASVQAARLLSRTSAKRPKRTTKKKAKSRQTAVSARK